MIARTMLLSAWMLLGAVLVAAVSETERVPARTPLRGFPLGVAHWVGSEQPTFDESILAVLGVDDYVNRVYASDRAGYVGLYIGFYASQRQGDTIHSPLNCLPGAGWEPVSRSYLTIPIDGSRQIEVNRYVIQKGVDRQVVLYWYQSHGRVVANEYLSKLALMYDAARLNRTDAALVRVVSPVMGSALGAEDAASGHAVEFVREIFPLLDTYLPL